MKWATSFLCFVALIGSIGGAAAGSLRPRIIGGEDAEIEDFPYQASLRLLGSHFCGGSIIGERHVLTAAHCINKYVTAPFIFVSVSTGTSSSKRTGHSHRIARVKVHPGWTATEESSFRNDLAVITLAGRIRFDERQQKIELASQDVVSGTKANLTGWGHTSAKNGRAAVQLQKLETTLLASTDCQSEQSAEIHEEQLCAYRSKGLGACFGDSGGPLAVDGQLVGVVSWVDGEVCADGIPEVYTNVYAYRDFIESVISAQ